ncbi:MAG: ribonuclease P protein component [Candidatus Eremiobacteraeota bacterium]|nr:ribonuclease P protein component [Candidatus Eremiobacteraeota bacterium]
MRSFASLRRRGDFSRLRRQGRRIASNLLTVYRADAASGQTLVGISTGRALGGAVTRNRVRRRILAILDELSRNGGLPKRLLIEARTSAANARFDQLRNELRKAVAVTR